MGFFDKIKQGLSKTASSISQVFTGFSEIDDDFYDELEESLILADLGMDTTMKAMDALRDKVKENRLKTTEDARKALREVLAEMVSVGDTTLNLSTQPSVVLVIGVNGVGKTTTIGKLSYQLKNQGKKVLVAAADTFRAAAIDQLNVWTDRAGVDIIKHSEGSDPAAVVFDALDAAKARNVDVVIVDTAGRLHTKKNLMNELAKISKIVHSKAEGCALEVLIALDGTTGQNAVNQAREFNEVADITGIILTKLDSTAKGGIVIPIANELGVPVKLVTVGEKIDDIQPFIAKDFVNALFED